MPAGEGWPEVGQQQGFWVVLCQPGARVSLEEEPEAAGPSLEQAHPGEPNLYAGKSLLCSGISALGSVTPVGVFGLTSSLKG